MRFGRIRTGGHPAIICDPVYLPMGNDSLEVKMPTNLIKLRGGDKVPIWKTGTIRFGEVLDSRGETWI